MSGLKTKDVFEKANSTIFELERLMERLSHSGFTIEQSIELLKLSLNGVQLEVESQRVEALNRISDSLDQLSKLIQYVEPKK